MACRLAAGRCQRRASILLSLHRLASLAVLLYLVASLPPAASVDSNFEAAVSDAGKHGRSLAADAAAVPDLSLVLQEQLMVFYGYVTYANALFNGGFYKYAYRYAYNPEDSAGVAYNIPAYYNTPSSGPEACQYVGVGDGTDAAFIGPYSLNSLASQMTALVPAAASLLRDLCAANSTCSATISRRKASGETAVAAITRWLNAQVAEWKRGIAGSESYRARQTWCPSELEPAGSIWGTLSRATESINTWFGVDDWATRAAGCTGTSFASLAEDLRGLQTYVLPPWAVVAETLLRDLVLHNAPSELLYQTPYSLAVNPKLAAASTGGGSGHRRLAAMAGSTSGAAADQATAARKDTAAAKALQRLSTGRALSAADGGSAVCQVAADINKYASTLAAARKQCDAAMPAIVKYADALDAVHGAGSSACRPSMLGLSFLHDALGVCKANGFCGPASGAGARAALGSFCAANGASAKKSFVRTLLNACDLLGINQAVFSSAASCCSKSCTSGESLSACEAAASPEGTDGGGRMFANFPSPLFKQTGFCATDLRY